MKKRTRFPQLLAAAALSVALLAGAGFAASRLQLFDMLNTAEPIVPLDGADALVATDLGRQENEYLRVIVQEGIYDGKSAMVKMRVEPVDPEQYVVIGEMTEAADLGEGYLIEEEQCEDDITISKIVGRQDGKKIIKVGTPRLYVGGLEDGNEEAMGEDRIFNSFRDVPQEDGSIEFYLSSDMVEECPDQLRINLQVAGYDMGFDPLYGTVDVPEFTLVRNNDLRRVRLVPEESEVERFELLSAEIAFTEVRGYLTAEYSYTAEPDEVMGVTLNLSEASGEHIATGSGWCKPLGDDRYVEKQEMQSYAELPERIILEVKVVGEEKTLGTIACRVEEIPAE